MSDRSFYNDLKTLNLTQSMVDKVKKEVNPEFSLTVYDNFLNATRDIIESNFSSDLAMFLDWNIKDDSENVLSHTMFQSIISQICVMYFDKNKKMPVDVTKLNLSKKNIAYLQEIEKQDASFVHLFVSSLVDRLKTFTTCLQRDKKQVIEKHMILPSFDESYKNEIYNRFKRGVISVNTQWNKNRVFRTLDSLKHIDNFSFNKILHASKFREPYNTWVKEYCVTCLLIENQKMDKTYLICSHPFINSTGTCAFNASIILLRHVYNFVMYKCKHCRLSKIEFSSVFNDIFNALIISTEKNDNENEFALMFENSIREGIFKAGQDLFMEKSYSQLYKIEMYDSFRHTEVNYMYLKYSGVCDLFRFVKYENGTQRIDKMVTDKKDDMKFVYIAFYRDSSLRNRIQNNLWVYKNRIVKYVGNFYKLKCILINQSLGENPTDDNHDYPPKIPRISSGFNEQQTDHIFAANECFDTHDLKSQMFTVINNARTYEFVTLNDICLGDRNYIIDQVLYSRIDDDDNFNFNSSDVGMTLQDNDVMLNDWYLTPTERQAFLFGLYSHKVYSDPFEYIPDVDKYFRTVDKTLAEEVKNEFVEMYGEIESQLNVYNYFVK